MLVLLNLVEGNVLLRAFWHGRQPGPTVDPAVEMAAFADASVRLLNAHKNRLSEEELAALSLYLPMSPVFADDELFVYPTTP